MVGELAHDKSRRLKTHLAFVSVSSDSFIPAIAVLNSSMFNMAGNLIGVSIFRADVLSIDVSNLCRRDVKP